MSVLKRTVLDRGKLERAGIRVELRDRTRSYDLHLSPHLDGTRTLAGVITEV
jgi:hypothetical protein